uniref:Uncharacterized protein n=1 Tax=Acrobeloides nanus TaxID=290746 RepID=A0A914C1W2_9BILA
MNSHGAYHNYAYLDCFKELLKFKWKYIILMQNHDILLRTNYELVKIFTWFNGTNDISADNMQPYMYRIDTNYKWTFDNLKLFKDSKRNFNTSNGAPIKLKFAKSLVESSVSREMIDYMINTLNLTTFMERLQVNRTNCCVPEETMLATLNAADEINAPGGFCVTTNLFMFQLHGS